MRITALTGETPLTPLNGHLLNASATKDQRSRDVLAYLSYEEKFLAGSWRFDTYFGRDTLMSLRLLMPALQPEAVEGGLAAVLQRLAANGEVAHEEDIGEFAVLRHRKQGDRAGRGADLRLQDDRRRLHAGAGRRGVPVRSSAWTRPHERLSRAQAPGWRDGRRGAGRAISSGWRSRRRRSAGSRSRRTLISLKPGINVGQWRDSEDGLGGGRYPYDVNVVFVPAAMAAIERFVLSGVLQPYLDREQRKALADAGRMSVVWAREAPKLFRVQLSDADARRKIAAYSAELGVSPAPALSALPGGEIVVNALALDAQYQPIPVLHSDGGFALLLQDPPAGRSRATRAEHAAAVPRRAC